MGSLSGRGRDSRLCVGEGPAIHSSAALRPFANPNLENLRNGGIEVTHAIGSHHAITGGRGGPWFGPSKGSFF